MKTNSLRIHLARILALLLLAGSLDFGMATMDVQAISMGADIKQGDTLTLQAGDWSRDYLVLDPQKTNSGETGTFVLQKHYKSEEQIKFNGQNEQAGSNVWEGSDAQAFCAEYYQAMPDALKKSVKGVRIEANTNNIGIDGTRSGEQEALDKVFLLSLSEYYEYQNYITPSGDFWLRSPSSNGSDIVAYISSRKEIKTCSTSDTKVARPAFNILLPDDICASAKELSDGTTDWTIDLDNPGHSYGDPAYVWSGGGEVCSAKAECSVCGKVIRETAYSSSDLTGDGATVYTVIFSNDRFGTHTKTVPRDTLSSAMKKGDILRILNNGKSVDYIVLDPANTNTKEDGMFVLLKDCTEKTALDATEQSNKWQGSTAQQWCTNYYRNLPEVLKKSIIGVETHDSESGNEWTGVSNIDGTKSDTDKVFFLSYLEYCEFRDLPGMQPEYDWLLRNYGNDCAPDGSYVGVIMRNGERNNFNLGSPFYARPAFNLDLPNSVKASKRESGGVTIWTVDAQNPTVPPYGGDTASGSASSGKKVETSPSSPTSKANEAVIVDLPRVKIAGAKAGKRSMTVRWKKPTKKNLKKIAGIEIECKGPKGVKIFKAGKKKTSKKVKKLLSKKKYYVRVRAYKKINGIKHVSPWSKYKTVKVR